MSGACKRHELWTDYAVRAGATVWIRCSTSSRVSVPRYDMRTGAWHAEVRRPGSVKGGCFLCVGVACFAVVSHLTLVMPRWC